MKRQSMKSLLSIMLIIFLIVPTIVTASNNSEVTIKYVYFQDEAGNMVFVDYEQATNDALNDDLILYEGIKHYVGIAEEKGRPIYIETNTGKIIDYKAALIDNLFRLEDIIGNPKYEVEGPIEFTHVLKKVDGEAKIVPFEEEEVVYIVEITPVAGITVELGTSEEDAISMLPRTTTILDSKEETHNVSLSWTIEDYNPNVEGNYTAIGSFELPEGIENKNNLALEVRTSVKVEEVEEEVYIVEITPVEGIRVELGTSEEVVISMLPRTTTILDSEGESHTVDLTWTIEGYNPDAEGNYTAIGSFELPEGIENKNNLELEVRTTVTVEKVEEEDFPEAVESVYVGKSSITNKTYANINIKAQYVDKVEGVYVDGRLAEQLEDAPFQWRIEVEEGTTADDLKGRISVDLIAEVGEPSIIATYNPIFMLPNFGYISVEVENVDNAAKFSVVFHFSDDDDGNEVIDETKIVNIGEEAGLIFYDPNQYDTVDIKIFDIDENLIHTFYDVRPVRAN